MAEDRKPTTAGEARAAAAARNNDGIVTAAMARRIIRHDHTGLWADFPTHKDARMKGPISLSFLLELDPEVRTAIAEGYAMHCLKKIRSPDGKYAFAATLKRGIVAFLNTHVMRLSLADLDERLLHRFKAWLDDEDREGFLANPSSRNQLFSALQLTLDQLMRSSEWRGRLSPNLRLINRPYAKTGRHVEHTPTLKEPDYERMYAGAAADIAHIVQLRSRQLDAVAELDGSLMDISEAARSPEQFAAWLLASFPNGIVPSYYDLGRADARFLRQVPETLHREAERILYPDLDELVPMVLVVASFFALNPSVALNLRRGGRDYSYETLNGRCRLRIYPNKRRASLRQRNVVTVTDHPDNPGRILDYLERRTEHLRRARPDLDDRIFLRFSFETRKVVPLTGSDAPWSKALKRFTDRHRISEFALRQLRPTTLDLVHELSGGNIIAMQGVATHTSAQTTYTFYTSDAQRQRNREKLGEMLMQMERWITMGGKIRPEDRPPGIAEHAAATPGFSCLDPKDSPIDGERPGELCTAYGRCPECPLAVVDPRSARSLAYLIMLNKRITEAEQGSVDPVAWHMRWAPVREELVTYWLRGWPKELEEQARTIPIPELPPVE